MAAPVRPKIITVLARNTNDGEFVIIRNLTKGGQLTQKITSEEAIFNPAPTTQWEEGDLIQGEIRGRLQGVEQKTIKKGGTNITLATSTDTTTPGVSL